MESIMAYSLLLLVVAIIIFVSDSKANTLIWSDEFDGQSSQPNPNKWEFDIGDNELDPHERLYYTKSTTNARIDGLGHLLIKLDKNTAQKYKCGGSICKYTSARMTTLRHVTPEFGRIEARIKLPQGKGVLSEFWLMGSDASIKPWPGCGEIDIMESQGSSPNTITGRLQGPGYSAGAGIHSLYSLPFGRCFYDAFHDFAIDWSKDKITWSVNGHNYMTKTPADLNGKEWVFNHKFFIILNVAIDNPDDSTKFPQTMMVDYVRVYKHEQ